VSECRYIPLGQRAELLIDKGTRAWQELQRLAMEEDELIDSLVFLGQELWLPHHETEGREYHVTLRVAVHYPAGLEETAQARVVTAFCELESRFSDDQGGLRIAAEGREG